MASCRCRERRTVLTATLAASAGALATGAGAAPPPPPVIHEYLQIVAEDGVVGDEFGFAVAVNESLAVLGAPGSDLKGQRAGAGYTFDVVTGAQIQRLGPRGANPQGRFGGAVAASFDYLIYGSDGEAENGIAAGSAHLFSTRRNQETAVFRSQDRAEGDRFGFAVDITWDTVIVGSPGADASGVDSGAAYLFDVETGSELGRLMVVDGAANDALGYSVGIFGRVAVAGVPEDDNLNGRDAGSTCVFNVLTREQVLRLVAEDGVGGDRFGSATAVHGDTVVVGAPGSDAAGAQSGAAYLFSLATGRQTAKLVATDGLAGDVFGSAVAIDGDNVVIGAWNAGENGPESGAAYLFDAVTGDLIVKLLPTDGLPGDRFGCSVAVLGTNIVVGAYQDVVGEDRRGSAYIFTDFRNPGMQLSVGPLLTDARGRFEVWGGRPNTLTYLAASLTGTGLTYIPGLNITLELHEPEQIGSARRTDASGAAVWELLIPEDVRGERVRFQACQYKSDTNVVGRVIQ